MRKVLDRMDLAMLKTKMMVEEKREAIDQIIIMFIIIAVAAGIAGLIYVFASGTLLTNFQTKMTTLVNNWFDHK